MPTHTHTDTLTAICIYIHICNNYMHTYTYRYACIYMHMHYCTKKTCSSRDRRAYNVIHVSSYVPLCVLQKTKLKNTRNDELIFYCNSTIIYHKEEECVDALLHPSFLHMPLRYSLKSKEFKCHILFRAANSQGVCCKNEFFLSNFPFL